MLLPNVFAGIWLMPLATNLEEMMAERGFIVDHSTLHRCVIRLVTLTS